MDALTFIDPGGTETVFLVEHTGVTGRLAPPAERVEERVPLSAGARLRSVRHTAREVAFAAWLFADTEIDLRAQLREIVSRLNPLRGDGMLRADTVGGDARELVCRYADGFPGSVEGGRDGDGFEQRVVLVFRAADDPYWRDVEDQALTFQVGGDPVAFFPFFPLRLSPSEVFVETSVNNDGDVEAWPVWVITGPCTSVTITNVTTGEELALSTALSAGQQVTIDTRPGVKTVTRGADTNVFGELTSTDLWAFPPGVSAIAVEMPGADTDSSVRLAYRRGYLAP